jgi:hypothetical protein
VACDDDDDDRATTPDAPRYVAPTTPAAVLENLVTAYVNQDIDGYDDVTHPDFVFKPSLDDDEISFVELNERQDHESTLSMFSQVLSVELSLGEEITDTPSDLPEYPASEGYRRVLIPQVFLSVETRIEGELWSLRVEGDPAKFIFAPDRSTDPTSYSVIYQQDLHSSGRGGDDGTPTAKTTWGGIKSLW